MTQGEINAPYYDGCGVFDDDPSNDCTQDCFGSWGGTAVIDECGNCGGNGPEKNKNCQGDCLVDTDCFGICGGKAKLDDCGKCDEDYFNDCLKEYFDKCGIFDADPLNDCVEDCTGIWGGKVKFDSCGICGGDNSTCADCAGTPYGTAKYDNCNICDDNPFNDCRKDCEGKWGGLVEIDGCGICGGDNSTCADCAGVPYGNSVLDNCNICDDNIENDCIQDCSGIWGGNLEIDDCGICGGILEVNEYCNCNMDTFDCLGVCGGTAKDDDCTSLNDNEISLSTDIDLRKSIKLDKSIYFNRTISYYDFFPEISNPFYDEIENLSLVSNYTPRKYHALNRTKELKKLKKHTVIGSDGKTFITSYKYGEQNILIPSVTTVDYYKSTKIKNNIRKQSRNFTINHFKKLKNNNSKSKMLSLINKDFGFTNIAINLSGQIEIKGELEFTDTQGSTLSSNNNESWNLDINQKQQFDLEGKVGDRLTVSADQNSESSFDFENSLLLEYKGYDNEIINSIQAGNIGLSLSEGSLFSVGMGKRAGVFGVKMVSQLGPLEINTIIGREKVKKESFSLGQQSDGLDRYDYQFIKDKYFFVDKVFKNNFYPLNMNFINEVGSSQYVIKEFKMYKRAQTNEIETDIYEGIAYIDALDTDFGTPENNIWIELEDQYSGNDYYVNKYYGYVRLNTVSSNDLIAIHYTIGELSADGSIIESSDPIRTGTRYNIQDRCLLDSQNSCDESTVNGCTDVQASGLSICDEDNDTNCCNYIEYNGISGFSSDPLILKVIKTEGQQQPPSIDNPNGNPTWELMMKNVYDIGLSSFSQGDTPPEIEIIHIGGQLGTETASPNGNTFLRIFGIDNQDSQGYTVATGDGKVDSYFINPWGDLVIPYDMPFSYDLEGYLGNPNEDLEDIFDSDLENISIETLLTFRESGDNGPEFIAHKYQTGPAMYFSSNETTKSSEKEFVIRVKDVNQNTTINLGFMIVDGSETLSDGSTMLLKGVDYSIDYFSGTLTLISDRAKNNSESLRISYDRNEIVSFDQKLIIGNSFKYKFLDESSLFGGAYFYKQSITDNKVEIGYEPMENFIWHLGGKFSKDLVNLNNSLNNSFLDLTKNSKVSFATEYAQIFPNPNPIGIAYIDDFESSKRYSSMPISHSAWKIAAPPFSLNNKECAEALSENACNNLIECSVNYNINDEFVSCTSELIKYNIYERENIYWYNPYNDIPTTDIWPNRDVEDYSKEKTLWIEIPENKVGGNFGTSNNKWWNGITTSLYASDQNQSNNKYLDIWLNIDGLTGFESHYNGTTGSPVLSNRNNVSLHIDIGMISEDSNDNGALDTEDLVPESLMIMGDGLLDAGEDKGLDACNDDYEDGWGGCLCFEFDHGTNNNNTYNSCLDGLLADSNGSFETFADILEEILKDNANYINQNYININVLDTSDPNDDNFVYSSSMSSSNDFSHYNGTENNGEIIENKYPDSEDLNGDQFIDDINSYFTYEIELDKDNEEIIESILPTNWKLFRIPLNQFTAINQTSGYTADWTNVKNVRLWVEGEYADNPINDTSGLIGIASIEIVGNEWEELGLVKNDDIGDTGYLNDDYIANENITIQLINNQENSDIYNSPVGVSGNNQSGGTLVEGGQLLDKEQSLVIDFNNNINNNGGISSDSTVFIKKNVGYSSLDSEKQNSFFIYKNMEMYFNGQESISDDWFPDCQNASSEECSYVDLCFRFGKDDNYYEIRKPFKSDELLLLDDPNGWQNLKINLDELTRFKLNRDTLESFQDYGIDGCSDLYESGKEDQKSGIPGCLPQELVDIGINTPKICDSIIQQYIFTESEQEICNLYGSCSSLINDEVCREETYNQTGYYQININDPNGDNYYEPGIECCDISDMNCQIDNDITSGFPSFYCPNYIDELHIETEGNMQYDCFNSNGEICTQEDQFFNGEPIIDDWDADGLYTPNAFHDDIDNIWTWQNYCENDQFSNENECGIQDWNSIDLTAVCEDCQELRIKGEPAINKMEYIMVGVKNNSSESIYGSVWINELRMTGVKRETGTAFNSSLTFNLGEVFNIDLSYKQEEANFHRLEQRLGSGDHSINYSVNLGFSPHELFKENYFQIPVVIKYSRGRYSPLYKPGSDIVLGNINSTPDYLQRINDSITLSTSIKTMLSDFYKNNLFFDYLLDNTKISYSYKWDQSSNTTILNKKAIYKKLTFDYNLNFDKNNTWSPFNNLFTSEDWKYDGDNYIIDFLKNLNFYYSPQDLSFNANIVDQNNYTIQRELYGGTIIDEQNIDLQRNFQTNIKLHDSFSFRYTMDMKNNLNDYIDSKSSLKISEFFDLSFSPGLKKSFKEQFSFTYTPGFIDWLGPRFTYVPNYSWTRDAISGGYSTADISSDNKFTASFSFSFQQFIENFYESDKKSSGSTSRSRGRRSSSSRISSNTKEDKKIFIINQPHFKTILKFLHDAGERFSSININYSYNTKNIFNNVSSEINPDYSFKLGLSETPKSELLNLTSDGIIISASNVFNQELKFSTSVQITNNLTLSNMEYRLSLSANKQSDSGYNETYSQSFFPLGASGKSGIPIFGWSINLRGLEKYSLLSKWFKTFSVSHTYNGEKNKISQEYIVQKTDFKRNFTPLLRFDMTTKNIPIDIDLTFNNTLNIINEGGQIERKTNDQVSVTFRYRQKTGFRVPIFFLRDFQIENEIDLSFKIGYDNSNTQFSYFETDDLDQFETIAYSKSYNLQPKITYNFSKLVEGDLWFNYIVNDNHTSGRKKETDIGFQVRVYFESFD